MTFPLIAAWDRIDWGIFAHHADCSRWQYQAKSVLPQGDHEVSWDYLTDCVGFPLDCQPVAPLIDE